MLEIPMPDTSPDPKPTCACSSIVFDEERAKTLSASEVRKQYPRFFGECSCGFQGIKYVSFEHYLCGGW